jgi:hypothetical protein
MGAGQGRFKEAIPPVGTGAGCVILPPMTSPAESAWMTEGRP